MYMHPIVDRVTIDQRVVNLIIKGSKWNDFILEEDADADAGSWLSDLFKSFSVIVRVAQKKAFFFGKVNLLLQRLLVPGFLVTKCILYGVCLV